MILHFLNLFAKVLDESTWAFLTPNANYHIENIYINILKVQTIFVVLEVPGSSDSSNKTKISKHLCTQKQSIKFCKQ